MFTCLPSYVTYLSSYFPYTSAASAHRASGSFIEGFMNRVGRGLRSRLSSWLYATWEQTRWLLSFWIVPGCGCRGFVVYISTYIPTHLIRSAQYSVSGVLYYMVKTEQFFLSSFYQNWQSFTRFWNGPIVII